MGGEKPNWDDIVPHIKAELSGTHNIEVLNTTTVTIKFEVIMIVADMIAKPHLLKMFQHNGIYGCMYFPQQVLLLIEFTVTTRLIKSTKFAPAKLMIDMSMLLRK